MNTEALVLMIATQGIVIACTGYFFFFFLTTPPKAEPDSFSENDDVVEREED